MIAQCVTTGTAQPGGKGIVFRPLDHGNDGMAALQIGHRHGGTGTCAHRHHRGLDILQKQVAVGHRDHAAFPPAQKQMARRIKPADITGADIIAVARHGQQVGLGIAVEQIGAGDEDPPILVNADPHLRIGPADRTPGVPASAMVMKLVSEAP